MKWNKATRVDVITQKNGNSAPEAVPQAPAPFLVLQVVTTVLHLLAMVSLLFFPVLYTTHRERKAFKPGLG